MPNVSIDAPHLSRGELISRLELSNGTRRVEHLPGLEEIFDSGAIIADRWRAMSPGDYATALSESTPTRPHCVGLVRFDESTISGVRRVYARSSTGRIQSSANIGLVQEVEALLEHLQTRCGWRLQGGPSSIGFSRGDGGLEHTTISTETDKHVGLHLDSWDRLPPRRRPMGSNRICVNLGAADRALQFVAVSADAIVNRLAAAGIDVDKRRVQDRTGRHDLARIFLEAFPQEPVLRLRIRPCEAYIAPTENLVHDGCAFESREADVTLTLRGMFTPIADAPQIASCNQSLT